jgi:methyl-accepting chemotaxis protein
MKTKSLRFKLIAGGVLTVLIPLLAVGYFSVDRASSALKDLAGEQVVNLSQDLSNMVDLVLREEIKLIKGIGAEEILQKNVQTVAFSGTGQAGEEIDALDRRLSGLMDAIGENYEAVFLAGPDGKIYADGNDGVYKGVSISDRPYYQEARKGAALAGNPVKSKVTGHPVVPVVTPIAGETGEFAGVLAAILETGFIAEKVLSVKVGESGYPFVVNDKGVVFVHPDESIQLELNINKLAGMEEISRAALAGETGVEDYIYKGDSKIAGFSPVGLTGWSVITTQLAEDFMGSANAIRDFIMFMTLVFLALTLVIVLFFANSISNRIMNIVKGLNQSSEQVASASSQVASTSQSLAEGSSEQASSLEETSSSLEEMAAQTRQNSQNADQADAAVKETARVVENGVSSMERMNTAISEIKESANETSKIIKTIDDIAFQTNLLALNAAVEAARAGEAGKGFAVVAEEVRNLAQRSAEAAQNTSQLIEKSQENANNGVSVAEEVAVQLKTIKESSGKVTTLISEIAAASKEQTQGIDQVNTAVSEMDKVVQQNAADSEESASAAEELSAQATEMERMVSELESVVSGSSETKRGWKALLDHGTNSRKKPPLKSRKDRSERLLRPQTRSLRQTEKTGRPAKSSESPETVIPLDEDDFRDF